MSQLFRGSKLQEIHRLVKFSTARGRVPAGNVRLD